MHGYVVSAENLASKRCQYNMAAGELVMSGLKIKMSAVIHEPAACLIYAGEEICLYTMRFESQQILKFHNNF
jgi:hypothetical protein